MFGAYAPVLTHPVRRRLLAVFLSAIPLGMLTLSIVLCVQLWTGSLRAAGLTSGLFGLANAAGLAIQGPIIDRVGARRVVFAAGSMCVAALAGFTVAGTLGVGLWVLMPLAAAGGLSVPAITAAVRAWLPGALRDGEVRGSAYALLSALFQGAVTIGPVVVSLALLIAGPELAVAAAAALICAATVVFVAAAGPRDAESRGPESPGDDSRGAESRGAESRGADDEPGAQRRTSARTGTTSPGLRTLLVAAGLAGLGAGVMTVAVPGLMGARNLAVLAAVAFAALALGEMIGALVFGARRWPGRSAGQLPLTQGLAALLALAIVSVAQAPWVLVCTMLVAGVVGAPMSIVKSTLLDDVAPPDAVARGYSHLVAVGLTAGAAGNALAGLLAEPLTTRGLLWLPVGALLLACLWTLARRGTLTRRGHPDSAGQP